LKIPVVVIVTKVDICPENILQQTLGDIQRILKMKGVRKMPMQIHDEEGLMTAVKSVQSDRIVPIFLISSVTGKNLDMIRKVCLRPFNPTCPRALP
jgi:GTPase